MNKEDQLQDYLNGTLSDEQRIKLENDPAFMVLLREWQSIETVLKSGSKIEEFRKTTKGVIRHNRKPKLKLLLAIAAAFSLLIGGVFWLLGDNNEYNLFDSHYQPMAVNNTIRNGHTKSSSLATAIDSLYKHKNYQAACLRMEAWAQEDDFTSSSAYYFRLGELYLLTDQPEVALRNLELVKYGYDESVSWLKAWAYYNNDEKVKAQEIFKKIAASQSAFQEEAKVILLEMK